MPGNTFTVLALSVAALLALFWINLRVASPVLAIQSAGCAGSCLRSYVAQSNAQFEWIDRPFWAWPRRFSCSGSSSSRGSTGSR